MLYDGISTEKNCYSGYEAAEGRSCIPTRALVQLGTTYVMLLRNASDGNRGLNKCSKMGFRLEKMLTPLVKELKTEAVFRHEQGSHLVITSSCPPCGMPTVNCFW